MAVRSTQEALEISAINPGKVRSTQEALQISVTRSAIDKVRSTQEALLISVTAPIVAISYPISPPAISGIGPKDFTMSMVNVVGETAPTDST